MHIKESSVYQKNRAFFLRSSFCKKIAGMRDSLPNPPEIICNTYAIKNDRGIIASSSVISSLRHADLRSVYCP